MGILRDGDQFELDLFPGVPWGGRSPRGLTRVQISLFLRQEPPPHAVPEVDPRQLELWRDKGKGRGKKRQELVFAPGAPSLLPLRRPKASRSGSHTRRNDHG